MQAQPTLQAAPAKRHRKIEKHSVGKTLCFSLVAIFVASCFMNRIFQLRPIFCYQICSIRLVFERLKQKKGKLHQISDKIRPFRYT